MICLKRIYLLLIGDRDLALGNFDFTRLKSFPPLAAEYDLGSSVFCCDLLAGADFGLV